MKSTYICNLWYKRLMLGYLGTQITLQQTKLHAGNQHFPMWKRHLNVIDVHGFSPNWQAGALGYELPIFLYYIYILIALFGMALFKYVLIVISWIWMINNIHKQFCGLSNHQPDPIGIGEVVNRKRVLECSFPLDPSGVCVDCSNATAYSEVSLSKKWGIKIFKIIQHQNSNENYGSNIMF